MPRIKTEYIPTNRENHFIKCELYYSLGGMNYFTYKNEPRGYYVSIVPVERTSRGGVTCESYTVFSGVKQCVVTVARKSKKAEQEALSRYESAKSEMLERFADLLPDAA